MTVTVPGGVIVPPDPAVAMIVFASVKSAVTVVSAVRVRMQSPVVFMHPPDQPKNAVPGAGTAVSFTVVPALYVSEQSAPQLIPPGALVAMIVPLPVPIFVVVKMYCVASATLRYASWPPAVAVQFVSPSLRS